jgi:uncharacterized protein YecT (DUF1311 family)
MPRLPVALALVVLLWSSQASAEQDCTKIAQQQLMNVCANDNLRSSDDRLNSLYASLYRQIGPNAQIKLKAAQKSWVEYRDKTCDFEGYGTEGGSLHPYVSAICAKELTDDRVKRLNYYLTCDAGDATCVRGFR